MNKTKKAYCVLNILPKRFYIFSSGLAIFLGGIIYILFRTSEPVFFRLFAYIGMEKWIEKIRNSTLFLSRLLPEWFVFSLPSGLWAFAYSLLIIGIWRRSKTYIKYFWFASIPILIFGWEVFQYFGIISGTFSFGDIILGLEGIFIGIFIGIKLTKQNNYEKDTI